MNSLGTEIAALIARLKAMPILEGFQGLTINTDASVNVNTRFGFRRFESVDHLVAWVTAPPKPADQENPS